MIQLKEVACQKCGVARLNDGLRCACGAYQNPNIRLVNGELIDVRYRHYRHEREQFHKRAEKKI